MKLKSLPSQATLHKLLDYDPSTGKLFWKNRALYEFSTEHFGKAWNTRWAGKEALTALRADGYLNGAVLGENYLAHRIIFMYLYGNNPDQIDHDDRNRSNNRASNLTDASAVINSRNCKKFSNNTSGNVGVTWDCSRNKWIANIKVNYKYKFLGRFDNFADAIAARNQAELTYGFHINHGR